MRYAYDWCTYFGGRYFTEEILYKSIYKATYVTPFPKFRGLKGRRVFEGALCKKLRLNRVQSRRVRAP